MATLVFFHAHPDDESLSTAGTMAKAVADGHRVILVVATRGEVGEVADGFLDPGETLGERREKEVRAAGELLGCERVEILGYRDSGMPGTPDNDHQDSFWQADPEEAAQRVAAILAEVGCDVLTTYDERGNYGHPDHVRVHQVGARAAELAGVSRVFEATVNRDHLEAIIRMGQEAAGDGENPLGEVPDVSELGMMEGEITHRIDARAFAQHKREAMRVHASQIAEDSFFLQLPDDVFAEVFGWEWFIERGRLRAPDEPMLDGII